MDEFVREQLRVCDCLHVAETLAENEVDEKAFRTLNIDDLRVMLPNKVGLQKRILERVESLGRSVETPSSSLVNANVNNGIAISDSSTRSSSNHFNFAASFGRLTIPPPPPKRVEPSPNAPPRALHGVPEPAHIQLLRSLNLSSPGLSHNLPRNGPTINQQVPNLSVAAPQQPVKPRLRKIPKRILDHKKALPIYSMKKQFLEAVRNNSVLIVKGETGSGKSTQLTQYLFEEDTYRIHGKICCTQPRRIAAKSLAKRVAEEVGTDLGDVVGYRIRFDNKAANDTSIVYMTDGILLQELANEPNIYSYSVVMLDEAHERSLSTDMLLGLLKQTVKRRRDLKVIVTSATLDCSKFSKYFNNAPIFEIPGRAYPVETFHTGHPEPDYVNACLQTVMRIHRFEPEGDILVFLGGQDEIERLCDCLLDSDDTLWVLPCYSALPLEEQIKVFDPTPKDYKRKVVVATNIAETSITIDGIVYVVDSGIVKISEYDPKKRLTTLTSIPITKAQAIQRSGRAGRTKPGKAYRLYSEETFNRMPNAPVPEIQRSNLEETILILAAHGIEDIFGFDFIDPPKPEAIESSLTELKDLQALDSEGRLTQIGRQISKFPLEPKLSKILITSVALNCTSEILTIISILSVQSTTGKIFLRPKKKRVQADRAKAEFFKPQGDHITFLNVFQQWEANDYSKKWCAEKFINYRALQECLVIREQLEDIMSSNDLRPPSSDRYNIPFLHDPEAIQKTLVSGYFSQVAKKNQRGHGYVTYSNNNEKEPVYIHPSSALFKSTPNWILYEELINTGNKDFLVNAVAIEPRWIKEYAPSFYEKLTRVFPQLNIFRF